MSTFKIVAVTNRRLCRRPLPEQIDRLAELWRPDLVILREKDLDEEAYERLAADVLTRCRTKGVFCALHTYPETARRLGCPAIHLPFAQFVRQYRQLTDFALRGTSVHSLEEALQAETLGASYITAGHIFSTECKPGLPPRGIDFLREICRAVRIPVYAIGGISEEKLPLLCETGAAGACLMSEMMRI